MPPQAIRVAYMLEFLVALPAVLTFWTEIGGAGHMDFVPWYTKFVLTLGASTAIVLSTRAAVEAERALNAQSLGWALVVVLLAIGMAAATYYVHVHEPDDPDSPDPAPLAFSGSLPSGGLRLRPVGFRAMNDWL